MKDEFNGSIYSEDELLPISGLQHFAFCERQWALIHIERQWEENQRTAEGRVVHERVHDPEYKAHKPGIVVVRSMQLQSLKLGLFGEADVVEFIHQPGVHGIELPGLKGSYVPRPVEYKRGKTKKGDYDRIQLCAQAMCLEEMVHCSIGEGDLYYAETRRRETVQLDDDLRKMVIEISIRMHYFFREGITPKPIVSSSICHRCSLKDICLPEMREKSSGQAYWREALRDVIRADD